MHPFTWLSNLFEPRLHLWLPRCQCRHTWLTLQPPMLWTSYNPSRVVGMTHAVPAASWLRPHDGCSAILSTDHQRRTADATVFCVPFQTRGCSTCWGCVPTTRCARASSCLSFGSCAALLHEYPVTALSQRTHPKGAKLRMISPSLERLPTFLSATWGGLTSVHGIVFLPSLDTYQAIPPQWSLGMKVHRLPKSWETRLLGQTMEYRTAQWVK